MSEELKPCPFCGGVESLNMREVRTYGRYCADMYCIECRHCLYSTMNFDTKNELYEFWNTRPIEDEKDRVIARLKEDLEIQKNLTRQACFESNQAYAETEQWKKMLYDLVDKQAIVDTNPKIVIIGKDTDVPANPTDNNVGSMEG